MLPIYICYQSTLTPIERRAVEDAVEEIRTSLNRKVILYGDQVWGNPNEAFNCADWYVNRVRGRDEQPPNAGQLDAIALIKYMSNEPWQYKPHIDMMLVSDDLTARFDGRWLNFCFGMTSGRFVVNSVHRYRGLTKHEEYFAVKAVVFHELGHVLGAAANLNRANTEEKLGPHCTNPGCVMRQGLDLKTWVKHATDCKKHKRWYCPQCLNDISNSQV